MFISHSYFENITANNNAFTILHISSVLEDSFWSPLDTESLVQIPPCLRMVP